MSSRRFIAAVGVFDGVHAGHRHLISRLVEAARRLQLTPMAITFSSHPLRLLAPHKAPGMLTTLQQRVELLQKAGAECVEVLDFDNHLRSLSASEFMAMIHSRYNVDALLMGFNNHVGHDRVGDIATLQALGREAGVTVIGADAFNDGHISSSAIRAMIADGNMQLTASALGRPYALTGTVVAGRKLGRTIGYPTANLAVAGDITLPPDGVYAARATTHNGTTAPAMVNIGTCPTVGSDHARTIEAHIINHECGDIYDTRLTLEFIDRIRNEQRFESLEALQRQLQLDRRKVLEILHSPVRDEDAE